MKRRMALGVLSLFGAGAALAQQKTAGKQRVIFQMSDNDKAKWNLVLNNVRNVQTELGKDNVEIEVIAYGPGIDMLKAESAVAGGLARALDDSVLLIACENTMKTRKVMRDEMYAGISYVMTGVAHIMKRQREGWAYIRV